MRNPYTVLICDDDKAIVGVTKLILKNNYETVSCNSGDEIFTFINKTNPDIILLDLVMPGIAGEVIAKQLKNHQDTKHIPVILFSASVKVASIAEEVGAEGFLQKPFDIFEMEKMISTFLVRYCRNRSVS